MKPTIIVAGLIVLVALLWTWATWKKVHAPFPDPIQNSVDIQTPFPDPTEKSTIVPCPYPGEDCK